MLVFLKYFGICLAAASSVWGTLHDLTFKTHDDKKRLTRAGKVAVGMTLLGLAISILSEDLQHQYAAAAQREQIATEARRTNRILLSAQPLTSLTLSLQFESSDAALRKALEQAKIQIHKNAEDEQGGIPPVRYETMEYQAHIIPLLRHLSRMGFSAPAHPEAAKTAKPNQSSVFALLPLDDARNTVLAFGSLKQKTTETSPVAKDARLPAGFAPLNDNARKGRTIPLLGVVFGDHGKVTCTLNWDLDPATLHNAVNCSVEEIHATAKTADGDQAGRAVRW